MTGEAEWSARTFNNAGAKREEKEGAYCACRGEGRKSLTVGLAAGCIRRAREGFSEEVT